MAFKIRIGADNLPKVGDTLYVYYTGTTDLVTGLVTADSDQSSVSNPFIVPDVEWYGFEPPTNDRIDIYWEEADKFLITDINVYDASVRDDPYPQYVYHGEEVATDVEYDNNAVDLTSTNVQDAIDELSNTKVDLDNTNANIVIYNNSISDLTSTNVQDAIDELSDTKVDLDNTNANIVIYNNSISDLTSTNVQDAIDELDNTKANINMLSSNVSLYPTSVVGDFSYNVLVTDVSDSNYDDVAVDANTGDITTSDQLLHSLISEAGLISGNPGYININTIGKIKKLTGDSNNYAEFYFEVYKRDELDNETLIATSSTTGAVNPDVLDSYFEFSESALLMNGDFTETDRIVIKFYGSLLNGTAASYAFQFGGNQPVRTIIPVPANVLVVNADDIPVDVTNFDPEINDGILSETDTNVQLALETIHTHNHPLLQPKLYSQINIKSLGFQSILGAGNLDATGKWNFETSNYNIQVGEKVYCETSGSGFTITLPNNATTGDSVYISGNLFSVNNVTVNGNGNTIQGDSDLILDVDYSSITLTLKINDWRIS